MFCTITTAMYAPISAIKITYTVSIGRMKVVAKILVTTKYLNGLTPETSIASICSVTRIEPSSAPIPELTLPAKISAVITGPNSLTIVIPTDPGKNASAPKRTSTG